MPDLDCDDVIVLLARTGVTLTGHEESRLRTHLEDCDQCQRLAREVGADDEWRWIARLPNDALDDLDLLMLPMIDPIVFMSVSEIASGGMGRITRAHDRRLGREVAIKEVLDTDLRARFEREAMITARLQHPAIVPIYEAGTWPNGSAFYTMRFVSGGTLSDAIGKASSLAQRLALLPHVIAVTEALAYAHARKIIHRDLKPQNVLVGEFGETVVIDWGLAKELDREVDRGEVVPAATDQRLTQVGSVMGTPCFLAPEQAAGETLDERADVFALGAILYNVLAGSPPYWDVERDTEKLLAKTRMEAPTPIATLAPDAPADLRAIVERAMARSPARRYPSAREMAEELRRFAAGQLIARQYGLGELLARWVKKHRAPVVVSSIAALLLAAVAVVAVINVKRSRDRSEASTAALLEEQGRLELAGAERERALTYLAESYHLGRDTVALHHLLAMATRPGSLPRIVMKPEGEGSISDVLYRPDGKLLTLAEATGSATQIQLRDGARIVDSFSIGPKVFMTTFSPDGSKAIVAGDGYVALWDVTAKRRLWRIEIAGISRATAAFAPSGDTIALSTNTLEHAEITVRDLATGSAIATLATPRFGTCEGLAFSMDGRYLAGCDDDNVYVWNARTYDRVGAVASKRVEKLAFVDGAVVIMTNGEMSLWWFRLDIQTQTQILGTASAQFQILRVSPDGTLIAAGDRDGTVFLWNLDGKLLGTSNELHSEIDALSFSPDSALVFGAAEEHRALLWNASLKTQAVLRGRDDFDFYGGVSGVSWDPGGHELAVGTRESALIWTVPRTNLIARFEARNVSLGGRYVASAQDDVTVRDVETGKLVERIAIEPGQPTFGLRPERERLQLSRDDRRVLVMTDARLQIFELPHAHRIFDAPLDVANVTHGFAMSRTGDRVAVFLDGRVKVFDTVSGRTIFDHATQDVGGDLSRGGDRLALATGVSVSQWQLATNEVQRMAPLFDSVRFPPTDVRFDASGHELLAFDAATPAVIDADTGRVLAHYYTRSHVMFDAKLGGDSVAAVGGDDTRLWNRATGQLRCTVDGASTAVALSADGQRLAIGYVDGSVRIHDTSCRLLETLGAHSSTIDSLAWTDAGDRLVAHSEDGFASIWDLRVDTRSADEIATLAHATPWTIVDGMLVAK